MFMCTRGGGHASEALQKYGYFYNDTVLLYGVEDIQTRSIAEHNDPKIRFIVVGTIYERKAQDLVLKALDRMDKELLEKITITFIGECLPSYTAFTDNINRQSALYKNIKVLPPMPRDALYKLYQEADCLICPSRDDPMPVVVTEMLALSKPVICSTNVGQSRYIQDGVNGYVFENDDADGLLEKIKYVVTDPSQARTVGKKGRLLYEKYFTMDIFRKNLLREINNVIQSHSDKKGTLC